MHSVTPFESVFILHQPKSLQWHCSKAMASFYMKNDTSLHTVNISNELKHQIAEHIKGKWLINYIIQMGSNLCTIENQMSTKHFQSFLENILNSGFYFAPNQSEFYSVLMRNYISQACQTAFKLPIKLFQRGLGIHFDIMPQPTVFLLDFIRTQNIDFIPCSNPVIIDNSLLKGSLQTEEFLISIGYNNIVVVNTPTITHINDFYKTEAAAVWAMEFYKRDRLPESLTQIIHVCNNPMQDIFASTIMALFVKVAARLYFRIGLLVKMIHKASNYITEQWQKFQLVPAIIVAMHETGRFDWAKSIYFEHSDMCNLSLYRIEALSAMIDCTFEQIENRILLHMCVENYHSLCTNTCKSKNNLHIIEYKLGLQLSDLSILVNKTDGYFNKADFLFYKSWFYVLQGIFLLLKNHQDTEESTLNYELAKTYITKSQSHIVSNCAHHIQIALLCNAFKQDTPLTAIQSAFYQCTKANLNNLKCKTLVKIYLLSIFKCWIEDSEEDSELLNKAYSDLLIFSSGKSYRLRILKTSVQILESEAKHIDRMMLFPNAVELSLCITKKSQLILDYNLFPNLQVIQANSIHFLSHNESVQLKYHKRDDNKYTSLSIQFCKRYDNSFLHFLIFGKEQVLFFIAVHC